MTGAALSPDVLAYLEWLTKYVLVMALLGGAVGGAVYCGARDALAWLIDRMPTPVSDRLIERARKHREYVEACKRERTESVHRG